LAHEGKRRSTVGRAAIPKRSKDIIAGRRLGADLEREHLGARESRAAPK
jgi:hypothetical protein